MITMTKNKPICECCNSDKYIHMRKGGGYRCERCKTIFDDKHTVIGEQNYKEARDADIALRFKPISTGRCRFNQI